MCTTPNSAALLALAAALLAAPACAAEPVPPKLGLGTAPTAAELAQFVSPLTNGRGLPKGGGSVAQGKAIYAAQCMACQGERLEGGIGDKLVGGRGTLVNSDPTKKTGEDGRELLAVCDHAVRLHQARHAVHLAGQPQQR